MFQIGSLKLQNWLVMAPMAGITNLAFRIIVKKLGAGLVFTEMISAAGLTRKHQKTMDYLKSRPEEKPLAVQIFGSTPKIMSQASEIVIDSGADILDLNMGCPVKKVIKTGSGAALMRTPQLAADIISAVRHVCQIPLTIKIRLGWSPSEKNIPEMLHIIEDCGADAVTIHGRYATQGYAGCADWDIIREIKSKAKIPIIGNGDIHEAAFALEMKKRSACDAVMIGRSAVRNPWIFEQILNLEKGQPSVPVSMSKRRVLILEHFQILCELFGEYKAALNMRGLLLSYTKCLPHSSRFRAGINQIKDLKSLQSIMENYFEEIQPFSHES